MIITTHLPDGTRDIFPLPAGTDPILHAWAVVVTGRPELGLVSGPGWILWRYTATQEAAQALAADLERTCRVERAVVIPTCPDAAGPAWTAIGYWDRHGELFLLAVVPGYHEQIAADPYGGAMDWYARVYAGNHQRALLEAYRAVDEAVVARREAENPPRTS